MNWFFCMLKMSVPKSKVLSVSKGVLGLSEIKTGCPTTNQNVYVNINAKDCEPITYGTKFKTAQSTSKEREAAPTYKTRNAIIDGEECDDVVIVEPTKPEHEVKANYNNPYASTREASFDDIKNDRDQLEKLVKTKDKIIEALSIMLNLVENNPLIVNKYIIAPHEILSKLIELLTEAERVEINLSFGDVGCMSRSKYSVVDKIYVIKNDETQIMKYNYADAIRILDDHHISTKFVTV